jgi:hypothetical protein
MPEPLWIYLIALLYFTKVSTCLTLAETFAEVSHDRLTRMLNRRHPPRPVAPRRYFGRQRRPPRLTAERAIQSMQSVFIHPRLDLRPLDDRVPVRLRIVPGQAPPARAALTRTVLGDRATRFHRLALALMPRVAGLTTTRLAARLSPPPRRRTGAMLLRSDKLSVPDEFFSGHANVTGDLTQKNRRDVAPGMKRDCRASSDISLDL